MTRPSLVFMIILTGFFLAACATGASIESVSETPVISERTFLSGQSFAFSGTIIEAFDLDWDLVSISNSPETFRIIEVGGTPFTHYASPEHALDLLIMNSPDYKDPEDFYADVQPMVREVFGSRNVLDFDPDARFPFNYYVTSYQYPENTATGQRECFVGLPEAWVSSSNIPEPSVHMPAWDCNIALSTIGTIGVSLDLGLILHRGDIVDRSHYNLFSSEHNSYATILHELSHAAFAMSDEVGNHGKFLPNDSPNVYRNRDVCNTTCGEPENPRTCEKVEGTPLYRCKPDDDTTNLMYFFPQPDPGVNDGWRNYQYYFSSNGRLEHIYNECAQGNC